MGRLTWFERYGDAKRQLLRFANISVESTSSMLLTLLSDAKGRLLLKVLDLLVSEPNNQPIPLSQLKKNVNEYASAQGLGKNVGTEAIYILMATKQVTIDRSGAVPMVKHLPI